MRLIFPYANVRRRHVPSSVLRAVCSHTDDPLEASRRTALGFQEGDDSCGFVPSPESPPSCQTPQSAPHPIHPGSRQVRTTSHPRSQRCHARTNKVTMRINTHQKSTLVLPCCQHRHGALWGGAIPDARAPARTPASALPASALRPRGPHLHPARTPAFSLASTGTSKSASSKPPGNAWRAEGRAGARRGSPRTCAPAEARRSSATKQPARLPACLRRAGEAPRGVTR